MIFFDSGDGIYTPRFISASCLINHIPHINLLYRTPDYIFINMRVFLARSQESGDRRQPTPRPSPSQEGKVRGKREDVGRNNTKNSVAQ
ncbi:MAG: hypothetical protein F6K08_16195 [Okeania sp. SIO1H6]|uniref:hypothetical protein n=1 Tax=Okeania sp. SIO1H5 TaxID=2607777 RepID=UPI000FADDAC7|nr:hypothetical protein [Okeania sp. SIO1H5]NES78390.1 hypothetical protein [Okeania sp. SIO1H4]NET14259.1 hypothetical protein [Okeania sp. SIO1H6]RQH05258.1 hypothetical protein D4Z78_30625 [Okeania hirsuta]